VVLSVAQVYPPQAEAVRDARWLCVDYLQQVLLGDDYAIESTLDDARLVVSELVTNAIRTETSEVRLEVDAAPDHVRIAVTDADPAVPVVAVATPSADHGRGLWIVDQIARRWGTTTLAAGKQVWAEIPLRDDIISLA
jgi:anti-sigma regulatory factor (Ser/Thr protein kinase)